jgi:hypothetical protein
MAVSSSKVDLWNRALSRIGETELIESENEDRPSAATCRLHYDDLLKQLLESREWRWATRERILTQIDSQDTSYTGDAAETRFDVPVAFLQSSQISVTVDGVDQTVETDYNVTPATESDVGYVTFVSAPAAVAVVITVETTREGWDHVYTLPADYVKAIGLIYDNTRYDYLPNANRAAFEVSIGDDNESYVLAADLDDDEIDGLMYVAFIDNVKIMPAKFASALCWLLACELAMAILKDAKTAALCMQKAGLAISEAFAFDGDTGQQSPTPQTPGLTARG